MQFLFLIYFYNNHINDVASNLHNIVLKINEATFPLIIIDISQNLTKLLQKLQVGRFNRIECTSDVNLSTAD